ncbi:MAG: hypothetical protein JSS61_04005 [Verrucomicrobia bacterium]|nr:hypothetical protein [Verrucomicrobiota bacterium]
MRVYLLLGFILLSSLRADETTFTLKEFFYHAQTAIERVEEEKIFFNPDKVHIEGGRIVIEEFRGDEIPLSVLYSDGSGLYITIHKFSDVDSLWICNKCTYCHYYCPTECERCGCNGFLVKPIEGHKK